jgi:hypothetical protein
VDKQVERLRAAGRRTSLCPILCRNPYHSLFRSLCRIRVLGSYIRVLCSLRSSLLLFPSWVLRCMVLFCLLLAFFCFTSIFVFMHKLHLLDSAQKYISITPQTTQPDNNVTQTMQKRTKRQIPQTSHHTNPPTSRTIHPPTKNTRHPNHNRTSRNRSPKTSRPRRLIPATSRNRNGRLTRHHLETPTKRKKKSSPSPNRRTNPHSHRRNKLSREKIVTDTKPVS